MKNIIWRSRASMLLAIIVVILPFVGLPQSIKNILFVVLGLLIALFSFARSHYAAGYEAEVEREDVVSSRSVESGHTNNVLHEAGYSTGGEGLDE